jgi:Uncharacterized protein conserved in bacteria
MKILADENVPFSIIRMIEENGYDIRWIRKDAPGISDIEVMRYAYQDKRVILTFDHDFGELAVKDKAYPSVGIILLRLHQMTPHDMAEYITNIICSRDDWEGHFSVLEHDRIRMRSLHQ